ncbi:MAG: hemolysin family protein [Planctomycetota bacterium]
MNRLALDAPASLDATVDFSPWLLAGGLACLVVAALGATVGTSLLVYSPTKLQRRLKVGEERMAQLRHIEPQLVVTARILSVLGGAGACLCAFHVGGSLPAWVTLLITAFLLAAVCGALPPALAATRAEAVVAQGWVLLAGTRALMLPLLLPARAFARAALRVARIPEQPTEDPDDIAEDIMAAVADSDRGNALQAEEKAWIGNIVDLKELQVSAIMTPRTDVVALPADQNLEEALQLVTETGHSRYPVHAGRLDEVVGLLYAKDVLEVVNAGQALSERRVRDLMRKPLFVPETMGARDLLRQLKQAKVHIAIVLDEYGGTAGLITVEDILEEIVGDLDDEFDEVEEATLAVAQDRSVIEVSGRARIAEVNEFLGSTELPEHDDYDTLAGYVFSRLGRIPPVGERVEIEGVEFTVLRGDARRIDRLRLRVLLPERSDTVA